MMIEREIWMALEPKKDANLMFFSLGFPTKF